MSNIIREMHRTDHVCGVWFVCTLENTYVWSDYTGEEADINKAP